MKCLQHEKERKIEHCCCERFDAFMSSMTAALELALLPVEQRCREGTSEPARGSMLAAASTGYPLMFLRVQGACLPKVTPSWHTVGFPPATGRIFGLVVGSTWLKCSCHSSIQRKSRSPTGQSLPDECTEAYSHEVANQEEVSQSNQKRCCWCARRQGTMFSKLYALGALKYFCHLRPPVHLQ